MDNEAVSLMLRRSFHFHEKKNSLQGRLYSKLLGTLYVLLLLWDLSRISEKDILSLTKAMLYVEL